MVDSPIITDHFKSIQKSSDYTRIHTRKFNLRKNQQNQKLVKRYLTPRFYESMLN